MDTRQDTVDASASAVPRQSRTGLPVAAQRVGPRWVRHVGPMLTVVALLVCAGAIWYAEQQQTSEAEFLAAVAEPEPAEALETETTTSLEREAAEAEPRDVRSRPHTLTGAMPISGGETPPATTIAAWLAGVIEAEDSPGVGESTAEVPFPTETPRSSDLSFNAVVPDPARPFASARAFEPDLAAGMTPIPSADPLAHDQVEAELGGAEPLQATEPPPDTVTVPSEPQDNHDILPLSLEAPLNAPQ